MRTKAEQAAQALVNQPTVAAGTGLLQRKCACGGSASALTGECAECGNKMTLQRRAASRAESSDAPPVARQVFNSPSQPLVAGGHELTESPFGHDFGNISINAEGVGTVPLHYPSDLADDLHVSGLTRNGEVHLGSEVAHMLPAELDALLAHESVHAAQQARVGTRGDTLAVEAEAHVLTAEVLAGRRVNPRLSADPGAVLAQTPYDKVVVERAKKRLELLNKYVAEHTVREGRRLRSKAERDKMLKKREKMDIEGFNPFAEIEQRGKMEEKRIAALNTLPLNIEVTGDAVKFKVKFHVRFEDPKQESKFGELKSSLQRGIELDWNQTLKGDVFGGRKFTIEPEVIKISSTAARDLNYWLITVRATDTGPVNHPGCKLDQPPPGTPTSVTDSTCDGGVMSIPPSHTSMPGILGHELFHLFGFIDRYMMQTVVAPGGKTRTVIESTRETAGRPDPLGSETGPALAEDLAFLFGRLGVYEMEETRGLDVLRELEGKGMTLGAVLGEIHRQEEIIDLGRDPHSLIRIRKDFRDKMIQQAEDL